MAAASSDSESDPWQVLQRNFSFAANKIYLCPDLLRPMVDNSVISQGDYKELLMESTKISSRKDRLLLEILPTRPAKMFPVFCGILRTAGQDQLANRLEGTDRLKIHRAASADMDSITEVLTRELELVRVKVAELEEEIKHDHQITQLLIKEIISLRQGLSATQSHGPAENISVQVARAQQLEREVREGTQPMGVSRATQKLFPAQDRVIASHDIKLAEHSLPLDMMDHRNTDGILLWKITEIRRRRRDAMSGKTPSIYSQPFYTSPTGYKMCARLYLNGDGMGQGSHLSLFFVLMRGEYDAHLPWPFQHDVTFVLFDQEGQGHVSGTFRPNPSSSSFMRPRNEMNVAFGCPLFVSLGTLDSGGYISEDCIFIKMTFDTI